MQVLYRPLRVTFELAEDRQGAQVGYPFPLVNLAALGVLAHLFSGASLVSFSQQRFDLVMEGDTTQHIQGNSALVCPLGVGVGLLPVLREGSHRTEPDG